MADVESRVDKLETKVSELDLRTDRIITKLDMFIAESREARQRHDAEIRELRQRQDAAQAKHDAEFDEMNARIDAKFDAMCSKLDNMNYHLRNMTIAIALGYAAMVVAVFLK